jgi:hypothetical protein
VGRKLTRRSDDTSEEAELASTERALAEDRAGLLCRSLSQIFGQDHPAVVRTLHDLAVLCDAENRAEDARALWGEARRLVEPSPQDADRPTGAPARVDARRS